MNILKSIGIKLFILTVTAMLFLASQFTSPSANENGFSNTTFYNIPDSQFIMGAFENGTETTYNHQGALKLNTWHKYTGPYGGWPGVYSDNINTNSNVYGPGVNSRITANKNIGMRTLMDRPVIEYIISGQRIDYQCEKIDSGFTTNNHFWFYAYRNSAIVNNSTRYSISDVNDPSHSIETKVKHCHKLDANTLDNDILVNSSIRANRELAFDQTNQWMKDSEYKWYIMPRIRIDSLYALGGIHNNDEVCKIIIRGKTRIAKQVVLRVKDFKFNGVYDGQYKEVYNLDNAEDLQLSKDEITNYFIDSEPFNYGGDHVNNTDIEIYWSGNCDMWIDRVRIENVPARQFLEINDPRHDELVGKVNDEIGWANQYYDFVNPKPNYFYFEECQMSHFPLIKALNQQITSAPGNKNELVIWLNYDLFKAHVPNCWYYQFDAEMLKAYLYDDYGLRNIVMGSYAMEGWKNAEQPANRISYHPSTLFPLNPDQTYDTVHGILSYKSTSPAEYDEWLQEHFDDPVNLSGENYSYISKLMYELSKSGMNIINCAQAHLWYNKGHKLKEPSNEELELQANLGLTNNAKGLIWFAYVCDWTNIGDTFYARGIMNNGLIPRDSNVYGQKKYSKVCSIDSMLERRGPYIMSFNSSLTKNCAYRNYTERNNFTNGTYFLDIITYKPSNVYPDCNEDNPGGNNPQGLVFECKENRYLQAATFRTNESDVNKYFMIVNRRCSPYKDDSCDDSLGGRRNVRIRFDINSSEFANYNNWNIIDIDNKDTVLSFDKRAGSILNLGWYMPGQGKLYKISPVVLSGGTLVSDETISGTFNCDGMVKNGGYNITISPATAISFADNAGIEMSGGIFTCGDYSSESPVTLKGFNNSNVWKGLVLENCSSVGIYNTSISRIKDDNVCKAVLISNCNNINIKGSTFNVGTNAAAINAAFTANSEEPISFNVSECNFNMGGSGNDALYITSNGASSIPVIIDWCTFSTANENSNALRLINVTGGAVKNSVFVNFKTTINTFGSVLDLYNNKILGTTNSTGILCTDGSNISMKPVSGTYLGGFNYIKNFGSSSSCINTDNSVFNINYGQNDFDLSDLDNSKFFTGTFSGDAVDNVDAIKNCFHKDSVTNVDANHSVTWYSTNDPVSFTFTDYSCELTPPNDFFVLQYTGYSDTIFRSGGGEGGGFNPNKTLNVEENVYKSLKDTVNLNLRKRNYLTVEDKAKQILTQYPDSLESISMVQKLYMASLNLDSSKIGLTKTFLENLIATNAQNPGLIKRAFYFIQKCKVKLGQYQSALDGFQYIMTQNPYTYEGLVASWDYAATYLLMGSGGSYKGDFEELTEELITPSDTLLSRMTKRDINTNKTKNNSSSEQITKTFYEKVKNVTKDDKTTQEAKVKTLEKKIETSKNKTEKNDAATELATMKQIKEVVKVKKPNTVMKHIQIMNDDIKKVFGVGKSNNKESENNLIPKTYTLYQNYPNPFNPTTKIAYDIPRDAKVKLVIYDILGREMKTLVNNEFKIAGKYITEFNGSNLASGIYFARILVNEGKDFMAVKKMVLLK